MNIKKLFAVFFTIRMTEHWDRLQTLEIFKSCLDTVQGILLEVTMLEQDVGQDNLQQSPPALKSSQFCNCSPCSDFPRTLCLCPRTLFHSPKFIIPCLSDAAAELLSSFPKSFPAMILLSQATCGCTSWARLSPSLCPGCPGALWLTCWDSGPSWGATTSAGLQRGSSRAAEPNNSWH